MKKLIYLFLGLLIVACSDDSSDGNQLFLEKYDSVVWEQLPLDNESYRIAFINSSNSLTEYYSSFGEDMEEMCAITPLEGTDGIFTTSIQEETENSLSILYQFEYDEVVESFLWVFTVTSDGIIYTLTSTGTWSSGQEQEDYVYTRTEYDVCF
tara:strand:+ start:182 stop:640 length:459 start_codon:yes stop_codon:yes gene_type:complete